GHFQLDQPADARVLHACKAQSLQRMMHGTALRIEHSGLEADMDADLHGRCLSVLSGSLPLWRLPGPPARARVAVKCYPGTPADERRTGTVLSGGTGDGALFLAGNRQHLQHLLRVEIAPG